MSRGQAGPISFLWLHRGAGASLKVWATPNLGCTAEDLIPSLGSHAPPPPELGGDEMGVEKLSVNQGELHLPAQLR